MLNIIIFGPPGCGKGTQSVRIAKRYNLLHISTGDIIRNEIKSGSKFGIQLKTIVEKGELVPYELIIKILESALVKNKNTEGYIFDGYPRTIKQAIDLDKIFKKENETISMVLGLKVGDDKILNRLLKRAKVEGRKDDTEDVIKNRLKIYRDETCPLIHWYEERGKFIELMGDCSIDEIFEQTCQLIDSKLEVTV